MTASRQKPRSHHTPPTFADMAKAFGCIDAMLDKLGNGWIHAINGQPVFRNPSDATWYDIPAALAGWIALWERISEHHRLALDLGPVIRLNAKLSYGTPITPAEVARCSEVVTATKRAYRKMDVFDIGRIVKTQLIANAAEEAGLLSIPAA